MRGEADNPAVLALREKISSMTADVKEHKGSLYWMMLESQKWAGYQVTLSTLYLKVDSLEVEKARLEAVEHLLNKCVCENRYRVDLKLSSESSCCVNQGQYKLLQGRIVKFGSL
ncbi:hypothetical protein Tco_0431553 [Tanacetum coccineum]